jgi:hypothetical protein
VPSAARRFDDHAKDAAVLLGWFGMTILMIGAPLMGVLSRRALFILLPIGAALLFSAFVMSMPKIGISAVKRAISSPLGLAALFLGGWMGLSLLWTPFPSMAGPRYAAAVSVIAITVLIIVYLPERRARPSLYLLPAGLVVTGALTLGMSLFGPASFRGGSEFDSSLLERSVLTLVLLVWPALGALGVFARWTLATVLVSLIALVIVLTSAQIALAAFALAAVTFAAGAGNPKRVAKIAAAAAGILILVAPLLPFVLAPLALSTGMTGRSTVAAMTDWRDLVTADGWRLVTGHGFDTARRGVVYGYLPAHTPRTILFEVWYELGLLGAAGLAAVFVLGLTAVGNTAANVAPALLAGIAATGTIVIAGVATGQLWFLIMTGLEAVAFGLLARSSRTGQRPVATTLMAASAPEKPSGSRILPRI